MLPQPRLKLRSTLAVTVSLCLAALLSLAASAQTSVSLQLAAGAVPQGTVAIATATVTVDGSPAKVGIVDLYDGARLVGSTQVTGIASAYSTIGNAVFRRVFAPGTHALRAVYRGTRVIPAATSPVTSLTVAGTPPVDLGLRYAGTTSFYNNGNWDFISALAISDLNVDGTPDIAALQFNESEIAPRFGDPLNPGQFTASNSFLQSSLNEAEQILVADLNGDGLPDLIDSFIDAGVVHIYLATGPGTYAAPQTIVLSATTYPQIAIADFNGDGLPDIVSIGYGTGSGTTTITSFFNDPAAPGIFLAQPPVSIAVPETIASLQAADFNGDGLPDLIASAASNNQTQATIILNHSASPGLSWTPTTYDLGALSSPTATADLNGDGLPDLIAGTGIGTVLVALNDATHPGILLPPVQYLVPLTQGTHIANVAAGYVDGDNHMDVVAADSVNHFVLFHGNGDGSLTPGTPITVGPTPLSWLDSGFAWENSGLAVSDLDGDGFDDVVVTEFRQNSAQVYRHAASPNSLVQTATDLSGGPAPVDYGQPIVLTATETATTGIMSGTVTFQDTFGGITETTLGTAPIINGSATFTVSNPTADFHDYVAVFYGDSTFAASQSSILAIVVVATAPTTTTLTSSQNPSTYSQPVTFIATVKPQTGTSIPSGAILFSDGHTTLATVPLNASGIATFTTSTLTANDLGTSAYHQITAVFVPSAAFTTSSASLNQVVNGLPSVAALTVTPGSGTTSTSFTLTAAVSSGSPSSTTVPTGRVLFYTSAQTGISGNEIGYANLNNGVATFTSAGFLGGTDYVLAVYMGDTTYAQTNSNYVTLTITTPATATTAAVSPEPSTYGQPVVFSTHVTGTNGPSSAVPTGQVEFDYCHGATYRVTLDTSGNASYISPVGAGVAEPAGSCPFTAKYLGDANFPTSTSAVVPYIVLPSGSATTLATSAANAYIGQPVTLTATIAGTPAPVLGPGGIILPPAAMQPTGVVTFTINGATLGSATVLNGVATLITTALPAGSSTIVATYAGDSDLTGSISGPVTEIVTAPDFTIAAPQPAITIQSRHKGSMPLSFTSLTGFNGPVAVSCIMPLPAWLTCEPPTVSLPLNGTAIGTLTLDTDGVPNWYGDLRSPPSPANGHGPVARNTSTLALALLPLLGLASSRKRRRQQWLAITLVTLATLTLSSCANTLPQHTAAGTYTIQLQATGQSSNDPVPTTHTVSITLTVTPE